MDEPDRPRRPARWIAALEVLICSGFPTQIVIITILRAAGVEMMVDGQLSIAFFAPLAILDTILLVSLIVFFLYSHGESPRDVFLGSRPPAREAALGFALVPAVFLFIALLIGTLRLVAPWLRTVPDNPLEGLLDQPLEAVIFAFVVVLAGGGREEIQRAFVLHRFEQSLGGAWVGLALFSVVFGLGHLDQGLDVVVATGALGLFWGLVYLWRRSIVAPAVSHAGFNLTEVVVQVAARRLGLVP